MNDQTMRVRDAVCLFRRHGCDAVAGTLESALEASLVRAESGALTDMLLAIQSTANQLVHMDEVAAATHNEALRSQIRQMKLASRRKGAVS